MTVGEIVTLITAIAGAGGVIVTILKVFKSMSDKQQENTQLLVNTHKEYAEKHVALTREVVSVIGKNTEAFKDNARSNEALIKSSESQAKTSEELKKTFENFEDKVLNNLLNSRGGKND